MSAPTARPASADQQRAFRRAEAGMQGSVAPLPGYTCASIWEGYKPGTEPGKDQRPRAPDEAIAAGPGALPMRAAPASGTGGLY